MRITGYQLMDRLEELKEQAKTYDGQFKGSLFRFEEDEKKADPRDLMAGYESCERKITQIQEALRKNRIYLLNSLQKRCRRVAAPFQSCNFARRERI